MKYESAENVVAVISLLAKSGSFSNLSPTDRFTLKMKTESLMLDDADPFVREVLVALKEGKDILPSGLLQDLREKY